MFVSRAMVRRMDLTTTSTWVALVIGSIAVIWVVAMATLILVDILRTRRLVGIISSSGVRNVIYRGKDPDGFDVFTGDFGDNPTRDDVPTRYRNRDDEDTVREFGRVTPTGEAPHAVHVTVKGGDSDAYPGDPSMVFGRMVVTETAGERLVDRVESPRHPTPAMLRLMGASQPEDSASTGKWHGSPMPEFEGRDAMLARQGYDFRSSAMVESPYTDGHIENRNDNEHLCYCLPSSDLNCDTGSSHDSSSSSDSGCNSDTSSSYDSGGGCDSGSGGDL